MDKKIPELRNCPYCGSNKLAYDTLGVDKYFVECKSCGLTGPYKNNPNITEATIKWNDIPRKVSY